MMQLVVTSDLAIMYFLWLNQSYVSQTLASRFIDEFQNTLEYCQTHLTTDSYA